MPFLICEPTAEGCETIEVSRALPDALSVVHAQVLVAGYHSDGDEPISLSNSFVALRHMKAERDLPGTLPRGWATVYGAYLVRMGEPAVTFDTKIYILEF